MLPSSDIVSSGTWSSSGGSCFSEGAGAWLRQTVLSFRSLESFEVLSPFSCAAQDSLRGHMALFTSLSLSAVVQETSWE